MPPPPQPRPRSEFGIGTKDSPYDQGGSTTPIHQAQLSSANVLAPDQSFDLGIPSTVHQPVPVRLTNDG